MEGMMVESGVSKEHLQHLGKEAAETHSNSGCSMTDAVISVLRKEAGMTAEHVKRVIEFANNEAYREKYDAMDGEHRVVNIDRGPAEPGRVLRELEMNDSAPALVKSAAHVESLRPFIPGEDEFEGYFDSQKVASEESLPLSRPHGQLVDLREKLLAAKDHVMSKLSSVEIGYDEATEGMYSAVRKSVMDGTSPAEISVLYQRVSPSPVFTKLALRTIAQRMEGEAIPAVPSSREKVKEASERLVNMKHPIVGTFLGFVKVAQQRAQLVKGVEDIDTQLKRVNRALYEAMS